MRKIVNRLEELIRNKQEILFEQLDFGACDASIDAFKSNLNLELPIIFYDFYKVFNGSTSSAVPIWGSMTMLRLSKIIAEKQLMDKLANKGTFDNWETRSWWNQNWVPFLSDKSNSLICIDTVGNFGGKAGQIILWRNDDPLLTILFESFNGWLEALYLLIKNFNKDIVLKNNSYQDYCIDWIDKIAKKINPKYPWCAKAIKKS